MRPSFRCCLIAVVVVIALTGCQTVVDRDTPIENPYASAFAGAEVAPGVEQVLNLFERSGDPFDLSQPVIHPGGGLTVHVAYSEVSATMLLQIWRDDNLKAAQVIRVATRDGKLPLCHLPPGNGSKGHTMYVAREAWPAHLRHGDQLGPCEGVGAGVQAVSVDPISGIAASGTWRGGDDFVAEEVGISGGTESISALFTITPLDSVPVDLSDYPPLPPIPPAPTEYPFAVNLPEMPAAYENLVGSDGAATTIGTQSHCSHWLTCPPHDDDGSDSGNDDPDGETGEGETGDGESGDGDDQAGDEDGTGDSGAGGSDSDECDDEERERLEEVMEAVEDEVEVLRLNRDDWDDKLLIHEYALSQERKALDEINVFGKIRGASLVVGATVGAGLGAVAACTATAAAPNPVTGTACVGAGTGALAGAGESVRAVNSVFDERERRLALEAVIEYREGMIPVARTGLANASAALQDAQVRLDEAESAYNDYVWQCASS